AVAIDPRKNRIAPKPQETPTPAYEAPTYEEAFNILSNRIKNVMPPATVKPIAAQRACFARGTVADPNGLAGLKMNRAAITTAARYSSTHSQIIPPICEPLNDKLIPYDTVTNGRKNAITAIAAPAPEIR